MARPFVIVGAGIAGLTAAVALRQVGCDVIVIERRPALATEGAGIQIGPNGTHVLDRLGILATLEAHAVEPSAICVSSIGRDRSLTRLPLGAWMRQRHGAPYLTVVRGHLLHALHDAASAAGAEVRYNTVVDGFVETADGVDVRMAGGHSFTAAGLIGADGVWSRMRAIAFGAADATHTGRIAMRALLPLSDRDAPGPRDVSVTLAPDAHLVAYPVSANERNVVLIANGAQASQRWSQPVIEADAAQRLAMFGLTDWAGQAKQGWRQWPLVEAPQLSSFARGRVVVIGDAAHAMMPFLAQGAVMAIEDAFVLARYVADRGAGIAAAFDAFSAARLPRTQRVVAAAARNGRIYHLTGPMAAARNLALGAMPGAVIMRGYDWLYGHDASTNVAALQAYPRE